ncbi:uncharacterized protein LOC143225741 [Tachypleus tridentatus]|uniref:uncharacterized protein LOC143225741 n=1 Tax=Tachypleus tridentatus TaxID=6853 RepID=UPI003FD332BB
MWSIIPKIFTIYTMSVTEAYSSSLACSCREDETAHEQWAKIVVALERGDSQKKAKQYMQSCSIRLASPSGDDNPEKEQQAVMVIKSKSKSKTKQRKRGSIKLEGRINSSETFEVC